MSKQRCPEVSLDKNGYFVDFDMKSCGLKGAFRNSITGSNPRQDTF